VLRSVDVCSEGLNGGDGNGSKSGRQEEQVSGESEPLPSGVFSFPRLLTFAHSPSLPLALSLSLSLSRNTPVRSVWILGLFLR
jgi:hypothetical protein